MSKQNSLSSWTQDTDFQKNRVLSLAQETLIIAIKKALTLNLLNTCLSIALLPTDLSWGGGGIGGVSQTLPLLRLSYLVFPRIHWLTVSMFFVPKKHTPLPANFKKSSLH